MKKAIYALSADPITYGHLNIIERASNMFVHVVVGIGNNASKKYTFSPEKRAAIAMKSIQALKLNNVSVEIFDGSLADFAFDVDANVIVRGLRNINDFQQEQELANINKSLNANLETCFILTDNEHAYISSSASKEIIKNNYFADKYLPLHSKNALQKSINKQIFIGITGLMGSGKSHVAEKLDSYSKSMDVRIHNLDLDLLCHDVYDTSKEKFQKFRDEIFNEFGTLERKEIGAMVFSDQKKLQRLNEIFRPVIEYQVRKMSVGKEGIILINGATILSMNLLSLMCNNRVVVVKTDDEIRHQRCFEGRGIEKEIVEKRDQMMMPIEEQIKKINEEIEKDNFGFVIEFNNNDRKSNIVKLYNQIIGLI